MKINVIAKDLKFPEGPVFTASGDIYLVELRGESISCIERESLNITRHHVGGMPNGMVVKDKNTMLFCDAGQNAVRVFDIKTKTTSNLVTSVDSHALHSPNDLIIDNKGNVLFTCPGGSAKSPIGYICCHDKDENTNVIANGMYFPNGLVICGDENEIIINESWGHRLLKGIWNADKKIIENIDEFYLIGGAAEPDGLAISPEGNIYASVYGTGMVWIFDVNGNLIDQIKLPGNCPTNLAFDPSGKLGLIVTEAERGELLSISL